MWLMAIFDPTRQEREATGEQIREVTERLDRLTRRKEIEDHILCLRHRDEHGHPHV